MVVAFCWVCRVVRDSGDLVNPWYGPSGSGLSDEILDGSVAIVDGVHCLDNRRIREQRRREGSREKGGTILQVTIQPLSP